MIRKSVAVSIALAGIAAASVGTYSYYRIQQQKSLRQGIAQTEQALGQVDQRGDDFRARKTFDRRTAIENVANVGEKQHARIFVLAGAQRKTAAARASAPHSGLHASAIDRSTRQLSAALLRKRRRHRRV